MYFTYWKTGCCFSFLIAGVLCFGACKNPESQRGSKDSDTTQEPVEQATPTPASAKRAKLPPKYSFFPKKEVKTSPRGLPYKFLKDVPGQVARIGDQVVYHEAAYKNDTLWYSSQGVNRPREGVLPPYEELPLQIKGVPAPYEGVQLMSPGDCLIIQQPLDTFSKLPFKLTRNDRVHYVVTLLSVLPRETLEAQRVERQATLDEVTRRTTELIEKYKAGELGRELQQSDSGLSFIIHQQGEGVPAIPGRKITAHYSGYLMNGENFDNSYLRGEPLSFTVGEGKVIKGWDEGLSMLNEGGKATFFVPAELGYAERGTPDGAIPPNADLVFYVEMLQVDY